jgi:hypothetical protein
MPPAKKQSPRRSKLRLRHVHVVVDEALYASLEAHARKLDGLPRTAARAPNFSAAARDALRRGLGLA